MQGPFNFFYFLLMLQGRVKHLYRQKHKFNACEDWEDLYFVVYKPVNIKIGMCYIATMCFW